MQFEEIYIEEFKSIFEASKHKILSMPGCHHLELLQDDKNPSVFFTLSKWESESHLNAYRKSETFGEVWPETKKRFQKPAEAWSLASKWIGIN